MYFPNQSQHHSQTAWSRLASFTLLLCHSYRCLPPPDQLDIICLYSFRSLHGLFGSESSSLSKLSSPLLRMELSENTHMVRQSHCGGLIIISLVPSLRGLNSQNQLGIREDCSHRSLVSLGTICNFSMPYVLPFLLRRKLDSTSQSNFAAVTFQGASGEERPEYCADPVHHGALAANIGCIIAPRHVLEERTS